ncbi:hypothetical protein FKM82_006374 [Ascaphus truei]
MWLHLDPMLIRRPLTLCDATSRIPGPLLIADIQSPGYISGLDNSPCMSFVTDNECPELSHHQPASTHRDTAHQEHLVSVEQSEVRLLQNKNSRHQQLMCV